MTDERTPAPIPPALPRRRWRGVPGWVAGLTVVVVVVGLGVAARHSDPPAGASASAPAPDGMDALYARLNTALADKDRELFFRSVDGRATKALDRWWRNMDRLGWSTGAISPAYADPRAVGTGRADVAVVLGADLPFPQASAEGETYTMGAFYRAVVDLSGAEPVIVDWKPQGSRPWDEGPLRVVHGDGVVLATPADQAPPASTAASAATASAWVRTDHAEQSGRVPPVEGFVVFATEDERRWSRWVDGGSGDAVMWDPLGVAPFGYLPAAGTPGLADGLATGDVPTGGVVLVGPEALAYPKDLDILLAHEFAHVLQSVESPDRGALAPALTAEGWATYQEARYLHDGTFPTAGPWRDVVRECHRETPRRVPLEKDFQGDDAGCAYVLGATVYAYAAAGGLAPQAVADEASGRGVTPLAAAERLGTPLSEDGWFAWTKQTYGAVPADVG